MKKICRNPNVLWREEEEARDEALAGLDRGEDVAEIGTSLLFANGEMVSLNLLGTEVWRLCDGRSVDEIVALLLERFDVAEEELRADVEEFLAELAAKGFISHA